MKSAHARFSALTGKIFLVFFAVNNPGEKREIKKNKKNSNG